MANPEKVVRLLSTLLFFDVRYSGRQVYVVFLLVKLQRISIPEIKNHQWFLKNLPIEVAEGGRWEKNNVHNPSQSMEEVLNIIQEARLVSIEVANGRGNSTQGSMDLDELDADIEDLDTSGDFVCSL